MEGGTYWIEQKIQQHMTFDKKKSWRSNEKTCDLHSIAEC